MVKFDAIQREVELEGPNIFRFLRDIIAIESFSSNEEKVVQRIKQEMLEVGFDHVEVDDMGNCLGYIGHGKTLIAIDGHIDTVLAGDPKQWTFNPFEGFEDDVNIGGRGTSDQKGGIASAVYAGKVLKKLNLLNNFTLLVTATVQEEDCDGLCWEYLIQEKNVNPSFVIISEPTNGHIYRGHRGRMEIKVSVDGVSSHGSAPERGENAIYKMAEILQDLEQLQVYLPEDDFLGKGTLAVSEIFSQSPSRCAVADGCSISIDRRLTFGETQESAITEIEQLESVQKWGAKVELYHYSQPSYTGLIFPKECYFPAWTIEKESLPCIAAMNAYRVLFKEEPLVDKWTFSTNAVSIMGIYKIPCIGYGPGREEQAHAPNEMTWKEDLLNSTKMYCSIPLMYLQEK